MQTQRLGLPVGRSQHSKFPIPDAILDVTTVVNETTIEEETPVVEFEESTVDPKREG